LVPELDVAIPGDVNEVDSRFLEKVAEFATDCGCKYHQPWVTIANMD
jgi:hypothetical protein